MNFKRTSTAERKEEIDMKVEFNTHMKMIKNQYEYKKYRMLNKKDKKAPATKWIKGNRIQGLKTREMNRVFN